MTSIQIGKVIYAILSNDEELQTYIGKKIFPIVAEQTTTYPFITYQRENISTNSETKDIYIQDTVSFAVNIVAEKYFDSVEIADIVRRCLEKRKLPNSLEMNITNCHLYAINEDYTDNVYVQRLSFECIVD
jgi:hypothetical protein